jgi:hypothetical protein
MIKMKKFMPTLGAILILITMLSTRYLVSKYGEGSRVIIITVALIVSVVGLTGIIYTKKYLAALGAFMMIMPLVVMTIGIYSDNIYISAIGLLLIFIIIPIMIKVVKVKNR